MEKVIDASLAGLRRRSRTVSATPRTMSSKLNKLHEPAGPSAVGRIAVRFAHPKPWRTHLDSSDASAYWWLRCCCMQCWQRLCRRAAGRPTPTAGTHRSRASRAARSAQWSGPMATARTAVARRAAVTQIAVRGPGARAAHATRAGALAMRSSATARRCSRASRGVGSHPFCRKPGTRRS